MRLLMIATGYPPYLFSENLCNGKLVMGLGCKQGLKWMLFHVSMKVLHTELIGRNHGTCLNRRLILSLMNRGIESNNLRMSFIQV